MRNPDKWLPEDPHQNGAPHTRRPALIGLVVILLLVVGGLVLAHVLADLARTQDCALSGRSNCGLRP